MNEYYNLIDKIAEEFYIVKGDMEDSCSYIARVIYSLLGRMGYASLWDIDETEDQEFVSITHFKHRIRNVLKSYCDIYPEIQYMFSDVDQLSKEIVDDIYIQTGVIYHKSKRITPSMENASTVKNITFTRGKKLSEKQYVSGVGTYKKATFANNNFEDVRRMFQLQNGKIYDYWQSVLKNIQWRQLEEIIDLEYLRMNPPLTSGYWVNSPSKNIVSFARTKDGGSCNYYIYKYIDKMMIYQLPAWMVDNYEYRSLSNGCLLAAGKLPKSTYKVDGSIVRLNIGYLYPLAELNFLKLYSWPIRYTDFPNNFTRVLSIDVFFAIKAIFETMGYEFMEAE